MASRAPARFSGRATSAPTFCTSFGESALLEPVAMVGIDPASAGSEPDGSIHTFASSAARSATTWAALKAIPRCLTRQGSGI
jgi:hypothetical protein